MCGIVGKLNLDNSPVSPVILKKMTVVETEVPMVENYWIEEGIGLGHRRLSILDLTPAGKQPMLSNDCRYILTYNGEITIFKLRAELEAKGYWFRSQTVKSFYMLWQNGVMMHSLSLMMFALVIFGIEKKKITACP